MYCKKQRVIAIIKNDGKVVGVGENIISNDISICPRIGLESGEGYELCKTVCNQTAHAEVNACLDAGEKVRNGHLYLHGHKHICNNCALFCLDYGIKYVTFVDTMQSLELKRENIR